MERRRHVHATWALACLLVPLVALWPATALADDPILTIEPATVEAPGEYSFTIEGEGWTPSTVYLLNCEMPSSGLAEDVDPDTCDTSTARPVAPSDGSFSIVLTLEVAADGLALGAGDPERTQNASVIVTIGSAPEQFLAETGAATIWIAVIGATMVGLGWMLLASTRPRRRALK